MDNLNRDTYVKNYVKKLNINLKITSILASATILISGIGFIANNIKKSNNPFNNNTLMYGFSTKDDESSQKKAEVLLSAIYRNNNIDDDTKSIFIDFIPFFYDNECQNFEATYSNLSKFNLIYSEKKDNVIAQYNNKTITIFDSTNTIAIYHEIFHLLADTGKNLNIGINEGMAEILTQEYFDYEGTEYEKTELITKILIEITNPDTLMKSFLSGDKNIMINELTKKDNDEEKANYLLELMDEITYLEQKNSSKNLDEKVNEIIEIISNYTKDLPDENMTLINSYINALNNIYETNNKIYFCKDKINKLIYIDRKVATDENGISRLVKKDNYKELSKNFYIYNQRVYLKNGKIK